MATPIVWNQPGLVWNGAGVVWNGLNADAGNLKMSKVVLNLDGLTEAEIIVLGGDIATGLTQNAADLPNPDPTPAQITTATDAFKATKLDADTKAAAAEAATMAKNVSLATLKSVLTDSASWAERKIKDPVKLAKVYPLKKTPSPKPPLGQMEPPMLDFGANPGELLVKGKSLAGAVSYEFQCRYAGAGEAAWAHAKTASKAKVTLKGLNSGQKLQVRVRAIGAKEEEGPWSDLVEHLVP
ncbi:MAG: fibronectin type III domain-containing protein [Chthoniobacteraceae bacterium]